MDTDQQDKEMSQKAREVVAKTADPVEKFRNLALMRGCNGIRGLSRMFRLIDDSGNKQLSLDEFLTGNLQSRMKKEELIEVFNRFDRDGTGFIDCTEFLRGMRPPMDSCRVSLLEKVFAKMDKTGDGFITTKDLAAYDVRKHPKFQNGQLSRDEVLVQFLKNFQAPENADDVITFEEFMDYYSGVSASIDDNAYFSLMICNCWHVNPTD